MPSIEEIDNQVQVIALDDKAAPIRKTASTQTTAVGPELPDVIKDVRERSFDDRFAELNRIPLFMRQLDETDGKGGDNDELDALKSLAYEGEPWEVATQMKENGNECFVQKEYKDACEYYTSALAQNSGKGELDAVCYANRAACQLELKNYGKALADCGRALKLQPTNVKALYRSVRACLAVDRLDEAQDGLERGLKLDPSNKPMLALLDSLQSKLATQLAKRQAQDARRDLALRHKHNLDHAIRARGFTRTTSKVPPDMPAGSEMGLSDPEDPASLLYFPTVVLYPCEGQSDFLGRVYEADSVGEAVVGTVLGERPGWDVKGEYGEESVDVFVPTNAGRLIRVPARDTVIGTILANPKVDLTDGLFTVMLVPKHKAKTFIDTYIARHATDA
ncbi:HSP70/90 co-chaperone [Savitreella phatthalungensis]